MSNFFSRIKNRLSQDIGGRYLGIVIEQVVASEPRFALSIFPHIPEIVVKELSSGHARVTAEFAFPGRHGKSRRADLAVLRGEEIVALAEIKYVDHKSPGNWAQLGDYIAFARKHPGCSFTYLTQYSPPADDWALLKAAQNEIASVAHIYTRELYARTSKFNSPSVHVFRDFLKEEYVVYCDRFQSNAQAALMLLMVRGLHLRHATGLGKLRTTDNARYAIELFQALMDNVIALSDWFYETFRDYFGNRFVPEFGFDAELDAKKIRKAFTRKSKNGAPPKLLKRLPPDARTGGWFWVYMGGAFAGASQKQWLRLWFGYSFRLNLATGKIQAWLEAEIYGQGLEEASAGGARLKMTPALALREQKARELLLRAVMDAVSVAVAEERLPKQSRLRIGKLQKDVERILRTLA